VLVLRGLFSVEFGKSVLSSDSDPVLEPDVRGVTFSALASPRLEEPLLSAIGWAATSSGANLESGDSADAWGEDFV